MMFQGRVVDALRNKKLILFTGAGVGQAAGLFGTEKLRDYIYEQAKKLNYSESSSQSFERLAASLQSNPSFGNTWLTRIVSEYFCNPANYNNLDDHIKLLQLNCLDSIFTTNYDLTFEQAAIKAGLNLRVRALDSITGATACTLEGTLNCYKLHGCADFVTRSDHAKPLVLSKKDWGHMTENRREILKELSAKVNSGCVVIFAGFNLNNGDNSDISRAVFEGNGDVLKLDYWQSNSCYALVISPTEDDIKNYKEDYSCEVLNGDFSTLVSELESVCNQSKTPDFTDDKDTQISFSTLNFTGKISRHYLNEIYDSFWVWHDQILNESINEPCTLDSWHEPPSIKMLANNRYIERDILSHIINMTKEAIEKVTQSNENYVISITGGRGAGKSVILLQLAKYCYETLKQPVIFLKENAFLEIQSKNESPLIIQGWESKTLDTILSSFFDEKSFVPVIIADNQPHRKLKAEQFTGYLSNHGKPCLLFISDSSSEANDSSDKKISIPNNLSSNEIEKLFDKLQLDRPDILSRRDFLLSRAKKECDKDILIIMYEWLDKEFRPFLQIISDTASLISKSNILRQVYILIATFHVAGYKPSKSLIIRASDYPADDVLKCLKDGDFGLSLSSDESMILYRHTLISNRLLAEMGVTPYDQLRAIITCINKASASDVRFFKDFLDYLFSLGNPNFSVSDIEQIKVATEKNSVFNNEWDLHHKYAAYLARDSQNLDYYQEARRYCDKALSLAVDDSNRSSIYHTLGNIEYKQYQITHDKNPELAKGCFERAIDKFELSKQLRIYQTEHAYVTHIDFINFQLNQIDGNESSDIKAKQIELEASKFATFWEALKVVDKNQQRYLNDRFRNEGQLSWETLPKNVKQYIKENANQIKPNKILFDCYIEQCLKEQNEHSRKRINDLHAIHKESRDPDILIPLMEGMKRAFLLSASSRSDIIRSIASELFDPASPIANSNRARGIRLLAVDSFVSNQFDYLTKHIQVNAKNLYQDIRPRFLETEYILPNEYYISTGLDDKNALNLFLHQGANCFYNAKMAIVMELIFHRNQNIGQQNGKFTYLKTPKFGNFTLKVPTVEITHQRNSFTAKCTVQYSAFGMSGNLHNPSKIITEISKR